MCLQIHRQKYINSNHFKSKNYSIRNETFQQQFFISRSFIIMTCENEYCYEDWHRLIITFSAMVLTDHNNMGQWRWKTAIFTVFTHVMYREHIYNIVIGEITTRSVGICLYMNHEILKKRYRSLNGPSFGVKAYYIKITFR